MHNRGSYHCSPLTPYETKLAVEDKEFVDSVTIHISAREMKNSTKRLK